MRLPDEALRRAERPVEMIVYPQEYHNKWQPSHILAMYDRSIEWFDYWLQGRRPADPDRAARWDQLRQKAVQAEAPQLRQ